MFTMMGIFAFFNGFCLLPAILSWVGPGTLHHVKEANQAKASRREALDASKDHGADGKDLNGSEPVNGRSLDEPDA